VTSGLLAIFVLRSSHGLARLSDFEVVRRVGRRALPVPCVCGLFDIVKRTFIRLRAGFLPSRRGGEGAGSRGVHRAGIGWMRSKMVLSVV